MAMPTFAAVQLLPSASHAGIDGYLLRVGPTAANLPQQRAMGWTDRWTPNSFIDLGHILCSQCQ